MKKNDKIDECYGMLLENLENPEKFIESMVDIFLSIEKVILKAEKRKRKELVRLINGTINNIIEGGSYTIEIKLT